MEGFFPTVDDPFWASLPIEKLEDENFLLEQYYQLISKVEALPDEEGEKSLSNIFGEEVEAGLVELDQKKDLNINLDCFDSVVKPTLFEFQLKRKMKILERVQMAIYRELERKKVESSREIFFIQNSICFLSFFCCHTHNSIFHAHTSWCWHIIFLFQHIICLQFLFLVVFILIEFFLLLL